MTKNEPPFSIQNLPLFLVPKFPVHCNSFVAIQWYGINQYTNRVGLKVDYPLYQPTLIFQSFDECTRHFIHHSHPIPTNPQDAWWAFSFQTFLLFLKFYFRFSPSQPNSKTEFHEFMTKFQFPLASFLDFLKQFPKKVVYQFEEYSKKHEHVSNIHEFLLLKSAQTHLPKPKARRPPRTPLIVVDDEKNDNTSSPININNINWTDAKNATDYFHNLGLRIQTACQFDPPRLLIRNWKPESCGGWDLTFECQLENGTTSCIWVHYSALQINSKYKEILKEYIDKTPSIVKHVEETSEN